MNRRSQDKRPVAWSGWIRAAVALGSGFLLGACILTARFVVAGSADPMSTGWPLLLNVQAMVFAFIIVARVGHAALASLGLYLGLISHVFAGQAPYPVAACIALAIHGLGPALVGALAAFALFRASWAPWRRAARDDEEHSG
jgi:hypothetical protein